MRTLLLICVFASFSFLSVPAQGQFLKKLGDKVEKSVERRVDRRTDQAVEKSLDKAEEGTENAVKDAVNSSDKKKETDNKKVDRERGLLSGMDSGGAEPLPENYTLSLTGSGPDIYLEYQM